MELRLAHCGAADGRAGSRWLTGERAEPEEQHHHHDEGQKSNLRLMSTGTNHIRCGRKCSKIESSRYEHRFMRFCIRILFIRFQLLLHRISICVNTPEEGGDS